MAVVGLGAAQPPQRDSAGVMSASTEGASGAFSPLEALEGVSGTSAKTNPGSFRAGGAEICPKGQPTPLRSDGAEGADACLMGGKIREHRKRRRRFPAIRATTLGR